MLRARCTFRKSLLWSRRGRVKRGRAARRRAKRGNRIARNAKRRTRLGTCHQMCHQNVTINTNKSPSRSLRMYRQAKSCYDARDLCHGFRGTGTRFVEPPARLVSKNGARGSAKSVFVLFCFVLFYFLSAMRTSTVELLSSSPYPLRGVVSSSSSWSAFLPRLVSPRSASSFALAFDFREVKR